MERRQFIGLSAYIAAAIALPALDSCSGNNDSAVAEPTALIRMLDKTTILNIGKDYLKNFPEENNKEKLITILAGKDSSSFSKDDLKSKLDKQCVEDFKNDNTVIVKGWVLSHTEARQCALFTLIQS